MTNDTDEPEYVAMAEAALSRQPTPSKIDPEKRSSLRAEIAQMNSDRIARRALNKKKRMKKIQDEVKAKLDRISQANACSKAPQEPEKEPPEKNPSQATPGNPSEPAEHAEEKHVPIRIQREKVSDRWKRIHAPAKDEKDAAMDQGRERYARRFNGHAPEEEKIIALEDARKAGFVHQDSTQRALKASLEILVREMSSRDEKHDRLVRLVMDTSAKRADRLGMAVKGYTLDGVRESGAEPAGMGLPVIEATLLWILSRMSGQESWLAIDKPASESDPWNNAEAIVEAIAGASPSEMLDRALRAARSLGTPYLPWDGGIRREFTKQRCRRFIVIDAEWKPVPVRMDADGGVSQVHGDPLPITLFSAYDGEEFRPHRTVDEFINCEFVPENSGAYMFAHNGSRADFPVLFDFLKKRMEEDNRDKSPENLQWQISLLRKGGRNFCMVIRRGHYDRESGKWKTKHTWTLIDFLVFIQKSLEEIGANLDIDKGVGALGRDYLRTRYNCDSFSDLTQEEKEDFYASAPIEVLIEYNENDLKILHAAVDSYETTVLRLGGTLRLTGSSTSLHIGRRMYLRRDIETNTDVNNAIEDAYVGGRTEVFRTSLDHGWYQDINSSYPYSFDREMPGQLDLAKTKAATIAASKGLALIPKVVAERDSEGRVIGVRFATPIVANATVTVPDAERLLDVCEARQKSLYPGQEFRRDRRLAVPPLPFKIENKQGEQHLYYPTGKWRSWFSGPDIEALIEASVVDLESLVGMDSDTLLKALDGIVRFREVFHFEPVTDFREYMADVYELRKEAGQRGDKAEKAWLKLIANGFYGKTGEREEREEEIVGWDDESAFRECDRLSDAIMNGPQDEKTQKAPPGSRLGVTVGFPTRLGANHWRRNMLVHVPHRHLPMASYVTGDARKRLWRLAQTSEDLAYLDTDSVQSATKHPDGENLGDLKTEYAIGFEGRPCVYAAEKCYKIWARKTTRIELPDSRPSDQASWEKLKASFEGKQRKAFGRIVFTLPRKLPDQDGYARILKENPSEATADPGDREKNRHLALPIDRPTDQESWTSLKERFEAEQQAVYNRKICTLPVLLPKEDDYKLIREKNWQKPSAILKYKGVNRINEMEWDRLVAGAVLPDKRPTRQSTWKALKEKYENNQRSLFGKAQFKLPDILPGEADYKAILREHRKEQRRNASITDKRRSGLEYHHEILFYKRTHEREMPKRRLLADGTTAPWTVDEILEHFVPKPREAKKTA